MSCLYACCKELRGDMNICTRRWLSIRYAIAANQQQAHPLTVITKLPDDYDNKRNMPKCNERVNRRGRSLRVVAASAVVACQHTTAQHPDQFVFMSPGRRPITLERHTIPICTKNTTKKHPNTVSICPISRTITNTV